MKPHKIITTFFILLISLQFVLPSPAYAASPQIADFLCERGITLFNQDRLDNALLEFQKALLANPNSGEARRYIGLIQDRQRAAQKPAPVAVEREQAAFSPPQPPVASRPRNKVIWRLERKMQEVVDAVVAEKRMEGEGIPSGVGAAQVPVPAPVAAALGIPVVPPQEVTVDLRQIERTAAAHELQVSVNDIVTFRSDRIVRYVAVDPQRLEVTRLGPESLRVVPQAMGSTVLQVWDTGGRCTFAFTVGPQRWQEAWDRRIEERRQSAELPESLRLTYSIEGDSTYGGRRFGTSKRDSHTYLYSATASQQTPFGQYDGAVQASRTNAGEVYIPNVRMSLTRAHYGTLKDIDIRWFDFSSFFTAFGFP
ncbi:MAG: pilus assembly protein N-terminal domain-containing protein, partial [Deltaproteobacteria bacterium]